MTATRAADARGRSAGDIAVLLWLFAATVVFVLEIRAPLGQTWTAPFAGLADLPRRLAGALAVPHDDWDGVGAWVARLAVPLGLLAAAALLFAAAADAGAAALRWARAGRPDPFVRLLLPPVGLGVLATGVHGAALCGLAFPIVARPALAAGILLGLRAVRRARAGGGRLAPPASACERLALAVAAGLVLVPALAPEANVDALIYHLPIPLWYADAHKALNRPDWAFVGLAQNQEFVSLLGLLAFGGDERWPKALSAVAALWLGLLVAARASSSGAGRRPWLAAALAIGAPILVEAGGVGKNDALFFATSVAAVFALDRAVAAGAPAGALVAAGALQAAAYGTKNFGLLGLAALGVALAGVRSARTRPAAWTALVAPTALAALPYVARNALGLGSPFYPFLHRRFPPVGWSAGKHEMMDVIFDAKTFPVRGPVGWLAAPVHALPHLSPCALALWPLAVALPAPRARLAVLLRWTAAYFVLWAAAPTAGVVRFLGPVVAPVILAAEAAAADLTARPGALPRLARAVLWASVPVQALAALAGPAWTGAPLGAALGRESRTHWHARLQPVLTELEGRLDRDAAARGAGGRVAGVAQPVQYPRPERARWWTREIEQAPAVRDLVAEAADPARVAVKARQARVRYVCYNLPAANFWSPYESRFPWSPAMVDRWKRFWLAHAELVAWTDQGSPTEGILVLYRLSDAPLPVRSRATAFLPGTEALFHEVRRAWSDRVASPAVARLLAASRDALAGVLAWPVRDAYQRLGRGDVTGAAEELATIARTASAADRRLYARLGTGEAPGGRAWPAWLAANAAAVMADGTGLRSYRFNLGIPPALPPAPARSGGRSP